MPNSKTLRVIIDTNLWVSFLIGKELVNLKALIVDGQVQPVLEKFQSTKNYLLSKLAFDWLNSEGRRLLKTTT